jgi:recombination protein RecA
MAEANEKEIKGLISQVEKIFGPGSIMKLGDKTTMLVEGVSTGALSLDIALGGKGLPRGRVVEIFGPESSGKTTIALHTIAEAQRSGGVAAFIDVEHALDPSWAKRLGIDLESLLVSQPNHAEEALQIAEMLVKSNAVDVIVIDSVAALVPESELKGDIGDSSVGVQARLMSQALRKLTPFVSKSKCCLIFINQIRQKIGVMFGNPETTSGGLALKFFSSVRLEVRRMEAIKGDGETTGTKIKVKVIKNKIAPPFKQAELHLMYDGGISRENDVIELAEEDGIIHKSGSNYYYGEIKLGNGIENAKQFLRDNPALLRELAQKVLEHRGLTNQEGRLAESNGEVAEEEVPVAAPSGRGRKSAAVAPPEEPDEE